ncbi:HupE/UreJ family protein [Falsiroseomonas sp. CW058]|uniref:HupE/UreJ family protein n=1 Tax=Falsiroseomonas sp. CW058 TaxID=3388664 RepID=UPI003D32420B
MTMRKILVAAALLAPLPALAHPGGDHLHGLAAGFAHPFGGLDHLAAMVAVGLWAGMAGGRARWMAPAAFLGGMAAGGVLGLTGIGVPMVEAGILASLVVLGLMVAAAARLPLAAALPLLAGFGLLHGHAHGTEAAGGAVGYLAAMMAATALLHGAGLLLASPRLASRGRVAQRLAGGATAAAAAVALLPW